MHRIQPGDIVQHFKREFQHEGTMYMYKVLAFGEHTETKEKLVVYQALYGNKGVYCRPYDMFMIEVDHEKYPQYSQKYRFEKIEK